MHPIFNTSIAAALALSLAACGGSKSGNEGDASGETATATGTATGTTSQAPAATEATPVSADAADAAPSSFAICKSCHSVEKGKHVIGPSLFGIYGTKAGDVAGYSFSPAMKASGLTWDDATLDRFLASPMKTVPGTRMTYAGQPDAAKRQELIAYIKSLK